MTKETDDISVAVSPRWEAPEWVELDGKMAGVLPAKCHEYMRLGGIPGGLLIAKHGVAATDGHALWLVGGEYVSDECGSRDKAREFIEDLADEPVRVVIPPLSERELVMESTSIDTGEGDRIYIRQSTWSTESIHWLLIEELLTGGEGS